MLYVILMERFWGLKETVATYNNVQDAIKAIQVKKAIICQTYPEAVFTISTVSK